MSALAAYLSAVAPPAIYLVWQLLHLPAQSPGQHRDDRQKRQPDRAQHLQFLHETPARINKRSAAGNAGHLSGASTGVAPTFSHVRKR